MQEKEYLYVGHYTTADGLYILKIGTTNDLKRRQTEHNRNYSRCKPPYTKQAGTKFEYDWTIPLSKYNTTRYEDRNRQKWQDENIGEFIRNDRFACAEKPAQVSVVIRKEYVITL